MIRRREALFFLFMVPPITGHVIVLQPLWDIAGRDAWISCLLAAPFGFLVAYMTWKLINLQPSMILSELSKSLWGPILGTLFNFIWMIYFSLMGLITLLSLMDMIQVGFYPTTPKWFIGLCFMALIIYSLIKGIRIVAWMAGILTLIIMVSGHTVSILLSPMRDWRQLLPILEFGMTPPIMGAILLCAIWTEMFVLAVVRIQKSETKGTLYLFWIGSISNTMMMLSVAAGTVTVFGMEQTHIFLYPVLNSVRMVSLAFIDRFDVYGLLLMTSGCFIRQALFIHAMIKMMPFQNFIQKHHKWIIGIVSMILFLSALFITPNKLIYSEYLKNYSLMICLWPLPLLYMARQWWIHRKKRPSQAAGK